MTYNRLKSTMQTLSKVADGSAGALVDVLFGRREPRFSDKPLPWTPVLL